MEPWDPFGHGGVLKIALTGQGLFWLFDVRIGCPQNVIPVMSLAADWRPYRPPPFQQRLFQSRTRSVHSGPRAPPPTKHFYTTRTLYLHSGLETSGRVVALRGQRVEPANPPQFHQTH